MPHYLDPDQIFPKRLGIMQGNTLVLQYYHLGKDRFKKHLIPFEMDKDPKNIVQEIFKNAKHAPYLKKVNPKNVRLVLEGMNLGIKKEQGQGMYSEFIQTAKLQEKFLPKPFEKQREKENKREQPVQEKKAPQLFIPVKLPQTKPAKPVEEVRPQPLEEPDAYYNQDFEDFEVSVSIEKPSNISSSFSKVDPSFTDKTSSLSKGGEKSGIEKTDKKKEVVAAEKVEDQIQEHFDFLQDKKKKKDKKDKKGKSKSKQKKPKKEKEQKPVKQQAAPSKEVQDEFQFL